MHVREPTYSFVGLTGACLESDEPLRTAPHRSASACRRPPQTRPPQNTARGIAIVVAGSRERPTVVRSAHLFRVGPARRG